MNITNSEKSLPPLVPGLPVLGNTRAMSKNLIGFIVDQYKQRGPVFRIKALNQEFVVLAGPEANIFATQEGRNKFSSREVWYEYGHEFGVDDQLQDIDGEPHLRFRKLIKSSYSAENVLANIPMLVDIAQTVVEQTPIGEEISALYLLRLIVTEQLGRSLANHAPGERLKDISISIQTGLNVYLNKQTPAFMLRMPAYQQAKQRYMAMGTQIVNMHRTTDRAKPDLVDILLDAHKDERNKDILGSEAQLIYSALGPFVAGLDTVANECNFMLYALFRHPEILKRCIEEADQLFAEGIPTLAQLHSLKVLHYAMMETLRLYSIAPVVTRVAAETFEFGGYQIMKGQKIMIATTAAHFLPELYPDPNKFDIERYQEPRKEHKQRGAYAPFGIGPHLCLGAGAAEAQIILVIAALLHMVQLEWVQPEKTPRIKNNPTPTFGDSFKVKVVKRRANTVIDNMVKA